MSQLFGLLRGDMWGQYISLEIFRQTHLNIIHTLFYPYWPGLMTMAQTDFKRE